MRFLKRKAPKPDPSAALADMKAQVETFTATITSLIPRGHKITPGQLDKAATDFCRDVATGTRRAWRADGWSDDAIGMVGPLVEQAFLTEFKSQLRSKVSLENIPAKGAA